MIRPGMDVFNRDVSRYIGSVVDVVRGGGASYGGSGPVETGSSAGAAQGNPELAHEEGHTVDPTSHIAERKLGEEMGPVPTLSLGNTGPVNQSASHHYATDRRTDLEDVQYFSVRPGRINLGALSPLLWVPADTVRSISMERIILDVEHVPDEWRRKPG